uniref:Serglycin n=1 Tax=Anas platyrhynchos platyrhynchos TaxID=8840 RepID=A0A493SWV9_ANAPP|eukprot:XP_027316548.1 serglycin isoform X1 [Anas platyrhynchos]
MPAKMQLPVRCSRRIFLAVCVILFVGCTAQGAPVQKARYKRVRCRPDAWSPNCIEEKAPWLLPHGGANRILPPVADPSPMKSDQMSDIFPLSEEESGSGLDTTLEMEPASGSGAEAILAPRAARGPELPPGLGLRLSEEALLL